MAVGDGTGRGWRRWMAPEPPMPRRWPELAQEALALGWLSSRAAQGLLDAAAAAGDRMAMARAREVERRAPALPAPPKLPFDLPPPVPRDALLFSPLFSRTNLRAGLDSRTAARYLARHAIKAANRSGQGKGSGGPWAVRKILFLKQTDEGIVWLRAVAALRPVIERLGLAGAEPRDKGGRPAGNPGRALDAASQALEGALQAAYERLGYPPPQP